MKNRNLLLCLFISFGFATFGLAGNGGNSNMDDPYTFTNYQMDQDTLPPIKERKGDFLTDKSENPFDLEDPEAIKQSVDYDPESDLYIITETIGGRNYRPPTYLTFDEYVEWSAEQDRKQYFKQLANQSAYDAGEDPIIPYKPNIQRNLVDRLFCGSQVDIRPQGNIDLTFGADYQFIDNDILTERQRRQGGFDFDMNIQMNVIGKIGEKLKLSTNYNTQATFDFENVMKIEYLNEVDCAGEDDIIKKIEAGDVSLPLRSSLIQGTQKLFGLKTELQFGRLTTTVVVSQQKSKRDEISIQGGTQVQTFEVTADQFEENRHFFVSHYNRESYEGALRNLPQINSLFKITKLEVWVTNDRNVTEGVRNIVALSDLGEPTRIDNANITANPVQGKDLAGVSLPDNDANSLYNDLINNPASRGLNNVVSALESSAFGLNDIRDFQVVEARKLSPSEYTYHSDLGFVSLNLNVQPDHVLGLSYQYTYNGATYQVGEFAQDLPVDADSLNVMFVKMLKSTSPRIDIPMWDLMMKNVYNLGAYQVNSEDFHLDVFYQDPGGGVKRFLPEGPIAKKPLLSILNLDNLNRLNDPQPDGQFDFVSGITILPRTGRLIFPVLEPFGESLNKEFVVGGIRDPLANKYIYQQLYDSTITVAREYTELNRYLIKGSYKSSVSSEISLGAFNIPQGSVTVVAGGQILQEGRDYEVDYNIGRIKILNDGILGSGVPIRVSFEDNTLFGFQTKTMVGTRMDFYVNDKFNIGGTFMHLSERPFTQKVNIGDDPISNNVFGLDIQYSTDAPWLTRLVDKIPLINTKAPSTVTFTGEVAYLDPGHAKVIDQGQDEGGTVFIDDFEGSASRYDLRTPSNNWVLASTPSDDDSGNNPLFPEAKLSNNLAYGANRARLAWYSLDNSVFLNNNSTPDGITDADKRSIYVQRIDQRKVFRNATANPQQTNPVIRTFDLSYYPEERGPYNFDVSPTFPELSAGIDPSSGRLLEPQTRWGGIMRSIETNNFEASNIEFIEFWVMSPFKEGRGADGGDLYIELGNISEDILKDSRRFFENGLPRPDSETPTDTTNWSRIPKIQAITNAFDNDAATREVQDVGLDGFDDAGERENYKSFLDELNAFAPGVDLSDDPSSDNFLYYRDEAYNTNPPIEPIIGRYKKFNNPQGNSPTPETGATFSSGATNIPDSEDINRDNAFNQSESYFQYKIPLKRKPGYEEIAISQFNTDTVRMPYTNPDGDIDEVIWYQYKVPLDQFTSKVGGIPDFRSIRFIRMYLTNFTKESTLRFARLELVRNQWRRYRRQLTEPDAIVQTDGTTTSFDVSAVNIEQNSEKTPFPYILPPGVQQERSLGQFANAFQNEQSLSINTCNLQDGDARGIYKILNLDMRIFERMKMFVHAENVDNAAINDPGDLSIFLRLGSDFENNYYEYEIPLTMSTEGNTRAEDVWLEENKFDFPLDLFRNVKVARDNSGTSLAAIFQEFDPEKPANRVRIKGNPDLGLVKGAMIGVRNKSDDQINRCVEVWANELRVTGFDERAGYAALGRLDLQMADFANVTLSGNMESIGWGSIDQKLANRRRDRKIQYDAAASVTLDKFFPKKWGIRLPFYAQISNEIYTPEYDPYQLDIPLRQKLAALSEGAEKDLVREQAETFISRRSLNFTNVRKERGRAAGNPNPWDISNFSLTYGWTEMLRRDPIIELDVISTTRGSVDYNYSRPAKFIEPFKKLIKKGKYLRFIKDFNFNPFPNGLSFRNDLERRFGEIKYRFSEGESYFDKRFTWDRAYSLKWDLSRSLNLNFTATNNAVIDEPDGKIDTEAKRDVVWENVKGFGRNKNYVHNVTASYTLPTKKFPILDWINIKAQYAANYGWSASSLNTDSLGNVIQNGQNRQVNGDFNFKALYNKSKYLKKINTPKRRGRGKSPRGRQTTKDDNKGKDDEKKGKKGKKKKKKKKEPGTFERVVLRPLMLVQRARLNYSEQFTTVIPGFTPVHKYLGQDAAFDAPGLDFAFGRQTDDAWLDNAALSNQWMTTNIYLNQQVVQNYTQTYDGKITLEPFRDFRIDVDIKKTIQQNHTELFKVDNLGGSFKHLNPMDIGSFNITYLPIRTLFGDKKLEGNLSSTFKEFEDNRKIISKRLGTGEHDEDVGFTKGYGKYQQDVLVPAFLAAYSGQDANTISTGDIRKLLPLPNWRLTYNGLTKIRGMSKIFSSFSLTHGYKSTLTVNSFATDLDFQDNPTTLDLNTLSFYSQFEIPDVVINEQLSPLIGIDVRFKNDLTARFDYKKSRILAMGFSDYRLTETKTTDITIGMGYRLKNFDLIAFFSKKKKKKKKKKDPNESDNVGGFLNLGQGSQQNDLNFKFDFSFRDDETISHLLDQQIAEPTRGLKTIRISPSIDYSFNSRLNVRLFYDYSRSIPATSASFPITNTQTGVTLRFSLAQ